MKKWVALLFICIFANSFSQTNISPQFSELKGMEDQFSNTHLFYRIYSHNENFPIYSYTYNDIYHLDLNSLSDTLFLRDYIESNPVMFNAITVNDYKFWNNQSDKFIYCGVIGGQDPIPFINRFDMENNLLNYFCCEVNQIDISRNDDSLIYSGGYLYNENQANSIRSHDGGLTWEPVIDTLMFLSLNPFNDNIFFLENGYGFLYRSTDTGNTFNLVDVLNQPAHSTSFLYDPDQLHIYRLFGNQTLRVSSNQGEPFSWQTKYSSDSEIFISIDESKSGNIYLADKKNIFFSTDHGDNFSLYKTLDRKIIGIYKKPSMGCALSKLYAATKYKIYEINPDTIQVIKSLPIPEDTFDWLPLNLGDMWVTYHEQKDSYGDSSKYFMRSEVIGYKLFDDKVYIKEIQTKTMIDSLHSSGTSIKYFRVDSTNGFVYRSFFINDSLLDFESFLMDLIAEVGDTIPFSFGAILESEEQFTQFGVNSLKRTFRIIPPFGQQFELVKGFGVVYDTVWTSVNYVGKLLGCVINGVMYGDTTVVSVEDEETPIATSFKLEQNYPNPFNPTTSIQYAISNRQFVTLKVYDVLGNEIATLVNEEKPAGEYEVEFSIHSVEGRNLPSGVYFYQLRIGGPEISSQNGQAGQGVIQTKKMILLK